MFDCIEMSSSSRNRAIVRYNTAESEALTNGEESGKRRKNVANNASDQQLNGDDIDRIVSDCVKYLLITDHKKTPVKRIDILKAVVKQIPNRKVVEEIIERVIHLRDNR